MTKKKNSCQKFRKIKLDVKTTAAVLSLKGKKKKPKKQKKNACEERETER